MRMFLIPMVVLGLSACHLDTSSVAQNGLGGADGGTLCQCGGLDAGSFYPDAADYTFDAAVDRGGGRLPDGGITCTCGGPDAGIFYPDASDYSFDGGSAYGCDGGGFGSPDAGLAYPPDAP